MKSVAEEKLDKYMSRSSGYAFNTYDLQGPVDAPLTPADVLMANLLSLQLSARDVIPLFADGHSPAQNLKQALDEALTELKDAKPFESYENLSDLEHAVASLAAANTAAIPVKWWTAVTVSKVLHRRRPHIVPIIDSRVHAFYGTRSPAALRAALWEDIKENLDWLRELAADRRTADGRKLSVLRLADIVIWMS
ncbi:hypothetical protein GC088_03325 [Arthrobacter sp. JZ12]|uniref:DUF6308 family protein n=1 Tax=Arthrobacter sp. JZ12 TaxID=2654190 RepID=UPI002B4986D6|nr:DUF6308 family protein [Arthrobacter sp. JZ12]WRH24221.1 hypothetical protein GC088_03325 [Arthrobacter sp. JZ12]